MVPTDQDLLGRERARLADGLHDRVLPLLAVLRQDLLEDGDVEAAVVMTERVIEELRAVMLAEHPVLTAQLELEDAIVAIAAPICARAGLKLDVSVDVGEVPPVCRPLFLGAVRELVDNTARHADASRVQVFGSPHPGGWQFGVRDDGVGVDPTVLAARQRRGHLGLHRLEQQLDRIGGTLSIKPGKTRGTTTTMRWTAGAPQAA